MVRLSRCSTVHSRHRRYLDERQDRQVLDTCGRKKEHKAANTIAIVIGAFVLLVFPRIILILYHFAAPETAASKHARFWIRILLYSNSVVNPVLYAWRHREFKREFQKIFRKCWRLCLCYNCMYLKRYSLNSTLSTTTLGSRNMELPNDGDSEQKSTPLKEICL